MLDRGFFTSCSSSHYFFSENPSTYIAGKILRDASDLSKHEADMYCAFSFHNLILAVHQKLQGEFDAFSCNVRACQLLKCAESTTKRKHA